MKKTTGVLLILLVISLIGNVYLLIDKRYDQSRLLHNEVSDLKVFTQNAVAGIQNSDSSLLRQTYSNFQSKPPFSSLEKIHDSTERVINKYEELYRTALKGNRESNEMILARLEKSFDILVALSESENLNEEKVETAMSQIDKVFSE